MLMPDPMAGLPPRLLRTPDAARFLGISNRTLEKHRTYGTGPVYRKIGGRVVYAVEDLQAWSAIGARKSTTDQTAQRVFPARRLTAAEQVGSTCQIPVQTCRTDIKTAEIQAPAAFPSHQFPGHHVAP